MATNFSKSGSNGGVKLQLSIDEKTYRELMDAFKSMPEDAQKELRGRNKYMMNNLAHQIRQAAAYAPHPRQAKALAASVRATRDRFPSIIIGGARKAPVQRRATPGSPRPTYSDLLYGTEFGQTDAPTSKTKFPQGGMKFWYQSAPLGRGRRGYFIFPTLRKNQEKIRKDFLATVEKIIAKDWGPRG